MVLSVATAGTVCRGGVRVPGGLRRLQSGWDERSSSGGFDSRPPPPTPRSSETISVVEIRQVVREWSQQRNASCDRRFARFPFDIAPLSSDARAHRGRATGSSGE